MMPTDPVTRESAFGDWLAQKQSRARLRLGVSFRNLHVHGFTSSIQFQPTVVSYALAFPRLAASLLSRKADTRVQILESFDGLIRDGEMLLVLGRPGSGCTTLLKTLAGDTHGIFIGRESRINYEGETVESNIPRSELCPDPCHRNPLCSDAPRLQGRESLPRRA